MKRSFRRFAGAAALLAGVALAGCGKKAEPSAAGPDVPAAGTNKGLTKVESWESGQPLKPGEQRPRVAPPADSPPEVSGTAEVIAQELVAGPGNAKYFQKVLEVEGVTTAVPKERAPAWKVKFGFEGVPNPFMSGRVFFVGQPAPGEEEKVKALAPGRRVKVIGYAENAAHSGIALKNCRVTDLGPGGEPTPVRPAEEVTAAFAADEAAARKKYGLADGVPAVLLLRGKVTESASEGATGTYRLAGSNGATVLVTMPVNQYTKVPDKGKTVTAGGVFDGYDAATKTLKLRAGSVFLY